MKIRSEGPALDESAQVSRSLPVRSCERHERLDLFRFFGFVTVYKFRFLSLCSFLWFSNVFCAFGLQVVQFLVTFILKVHLEESRRKKSLIVFAG